MLCFFKSWRHSTKHPLPAASSDSSAAHLACTHASLARFTLLCKISAFQLHHIFAVGIVSVPSKTAPAVIFADCASESGRFSSPENSNLILIASPEVSRPSAPRNYLCSGKYLRVAEKFSCIPYAKLCLAFVQLQTAGHGPCLVNSPSATTTKRVITKWLLSKCSGL